LGNANEGIAGLGIFFADCCSMVSLRFGFLDFAANSSEQGARYASMNASVQALRVEASASPMMRLNFALKRVERPSSSVCTGHHVLPAEQNPFLELADGELEFRHQQQRTVRKWQKRIRATDFVHIKLHEVAGRIAGK